MVQDRGILTMTRVTKIVRVSRSTGITDLIVTRAVSAIAELLVEI